MSGSTKITFGVIILLVILQGVYTYLHSARTAYIVTADVYNEFPLKKDKEQKLKQVLQARKMLLDSLRLNLQNSAKTVDQKDAESINRFNRLREQYVQKEKQFKEDNGTMAQAYTDEIWKQLNQYIKDYGKSHTYKYIYGVNGEGTLMYADEAENITKDVQQYVNSKYQGN